VLCERERKLLTPARDLDYNHKHADGQRLERHMINPLLDEAMRRADEAADALFAAAEEANRHGSSRLEALVDAAYHYRMAEKNLKTVSEMVYSLNGKRYTIITVKAR